MQGKSTLSPSILVVDDDPTSLRWLVETLQRAGYGDVAALGDSREVTAECQRRRPDLILLDLDMPHLDGCQVLDELLSLRDAVPPVVVIKDLGRSDLLLQALERGANDFVTRPFNRHEVLLRVRSVLYSEAAQRKLRESEQARKRLEAELEASVAAHAEELRRVNERLRLEFLTSIRTMANLIEMRAGTLSGRGREVARVAREIGQAMGADAALLQDVSVAALLCRIGEITLPDTLLQKPAHLRRPEERAQYQRHPVLGAQALMAMDELQQPALLIRHQLERYDGTGVPEGRKGADIPLGARILAVARAYVEETATQGGAAGVVSTQLPPPILAGRGSVFDPQVVDALKAMLVQKAQAPVSERDDMSRTLHGVPIRPGKPVVTLGTDQLRPGMDLMRSLYSRQGLLLLASGQQLSGDMIRRLQEFERSEGQSLQVAVAVTPPSR